MDFSKIDIPGYTGINVKDVTARQTAGDALSKGNNAYNLANSLNNNRLLPSKRVFVLIGDSYGTGNTMYDGNQTGWVERLKTVANFGTVYSSAIDGAGFLAGDRFLSQLQNLAKQIPDKNAVTDIVVVGGYNDKEENQTTLAGAIIEFCNHVKTNYPNAILHVGCAGWSKNYHDALKIATKVAFSYRRASYYGARWMAGVDTCLHDYNNLVSDGFHPNQEGQIALTSAIYNSLMFSDADPEFTHINAQLTGVGNFSGYSGNLTSSLKGGVTITFKSDYLYATCTPHDITANAYENIAEISGGTMNGTVTSPETEPTSVYVPCYIDYTGDDPMQTIKLSMSYEGGKNYLRFSIVGVVGTKFTAVKAINIFPFSIISLTSLS